MPARQRHASPSCNSKDSLCTAPETRQRALATLASAQHGVVSRPQLRRLGFSNRQVDLQLLTQRLHPVHRGVFAVGHRRLTSSGRWLAAVLAAGDGAALGYRSAAALWAIRPSSSRVTEVVVVQAAPLSRIDVIGHRHPTAQPDEFATHDAIPVTSLARTLLDLGAVISAGEVRRAIAQAEVLRLFDLTEVITLLRRHPRHRGARHLRQILGTWTEPQRTRSPLEEAFPHLCARFGLPRPVMNSTVAGMEVDALFPDQGVAVELDGQRFHSGLLHWETDHEKRARLAAEGWELLAFTYRQQTENDGRFVAETLGPVLRRRLLRSA